MRFYRLWLYVGFFVNGLHILITKLPILIIQMDISYNLGGEGKLKGQVDFRGFTVIKK